MEVSASTAQRADEDAALWKAIATLDRNQAQQTTLLESLTKSVSSLASDTKGIEQVIAQGGKTNWGVLLSAFGVFLTVLVIIGGLVAYSWTRDISRVGDAVVQLQQRFYEHTVNGHPASVVARIDANKEAIQAQVDNNRREQDQISDRINRLEGSLEGGLYNHQAECR